MDHALAVTSGTAAIHLALRWFGVQQGDIVFSLDFTFIGSCAPVLYEKAIPVFNDSEPDSWNMSPLALEKAFEWAKREGKMSKAVIIVDLYGESANWDSLLPICRKYGVPVIEDAAEAVGTAYKGRKCGSFGDVSVQSLQEGMRLFGMVHNTICRARVKTAYAILCIYGQKRIKPCFQICQLTNLTKMNKLTYELLAGLLIRLLLGGKRCVGEVNEDEGCLVA